MTSSIGKNNRVKETEELFGPTPLGRCLTRETSERAALLTHGFVLAHFLFPERSVAIEIVVRALNKLKARVGQEHKRTYWRDKFLKWQITRITKEDHDTLQWLIYIESDSYEKEQEEQGQAGVDDMVVRYIKTLIRISTGMSSFYVNLAVHRLLFCYTTSETQEIYEMVVDSYRGADTYRRAKRSLMLKLEERFAGRMRVIKTGHGEARYEPVEAPERFSALAFQCLRLFTPWSTQNNCPLKNFSGTSSYGLQEVFRHDCNNSSDPDKIEISRCHAFIDPDCLACLGRVLGLESHSSKLEIPRFYMDADQNVGPLSSRLPKAPFGDQEKRSIEDALAAEEARRKKIVARVITLVVDGTARGRMDLEIEPEFQFDVPFGAKLIEIWTEDKEGPLVLATHLLEHRDSARAVRRKFTLPLGGKLSLSLATVRRGNWEADSTAISVSVEAKKRESLTSRSQQWWASAQAAPAYAIMLVLILALTILWNGDQRRWRNEEARSNDQRNVLSQGQAASSAVPERGAPTAATYRLMPDDLITRGSIRVEDHAIPIPRHAALINLELPVATAGALYHVALRPLDGREVILVENDLVAVRRGSTIVLTFSLPSTTLASNRYYRVELRKAAQSQGLQTFTFYTVPVVP
jgi:hypothetical protein